MFRLECDCGRVHQASMFYLRDKGWFQRYAETATDRFLESV